jgi:multidrug resistance protein MdtO
VAESGIRPSPALYFLRTELASTPRRQRATLRIVLASVIATTLIAGFHIPEGHWLIITILTVSQPDAGESVTKGLHRLVGTLVGGGLAMIAVVAFTDLPWLMFPAVCIGVAFGLFTARTCTAPYAALISTLTFVLVALAHVASPTAAIGVGLWRIFMIAVGVVIATGVQVFAWPDDPEEFLLDDLVRRLANVEAALGRLLEVRTPARMGGPVPLVDILAASGLPGQLDLLTSAEARHPAIRRRHTEQVALIIEVERLITGSLWLERMGARPGSPVLVDEAVRGRLRALREGCARAGQALRARRAMEPVDSRSAAPGPPPDAGAPDSALAILGNMEQSLRRLPVATAFLSSSLDPPPVDPGVPALDAPESTPFTTSGFSPSNTEAIRFALKATLALALSYLIMVGLDWPSIFTCVVSCVLVAQSTLGATANKSILRLAGAILGWLIAFLIVLLVMPNIESLVAYLLAVAAGFAVVAWITVGSSRISYIGIQAGVALALALVDAQRPSLDLLTARDRVLGILVGIVVMMAIDHAVWPVRASRSMRPTLAGALRSLAGLAAMHSMRLGYSRRVAHAAELRRHVYGELSAALRLREESRLEPGAGTAAAHDEREHTLRFIGDIQAIFLALLVLARHRLTGGFVDLVGPLADAVETFHAAVGQRLEGLASTIVGGPLPSAPDLPAALHALEAAVAATRHGPPPFADDPAIARAADGLLAIDREVVELVGHLESDLAQMPAPADASRRAGQAGAGQGRGR